MSEPGTRSAQVHDVLPGVRHWRVEDDRIRFRSDAYAVVGRTGTVLIDPLPMTAEAASHLGEVAAICITAACHQRSAWRLQQELGVPVWAPEAAGKLEGTPDARFHDGAPLPGGLTALDRPGPSAPHYVFRWRTLDGRTVLFIGDLAMRAGDEPFVFVPPDHQEEPRRIRSSVRSLLELRPDVICPAHGDPCVGAGTDALADLLRRDEADA